MARARKVSEGLDVMGKAPAVAAGGAGPQGLRQEGMCGGTADSKGAEGRRPGLPCVGRCFQGPGLCVSREQEAGRQ